MTLLHPKNRELGPLCGKTPDLASLRGSPVLIDLWATWCGPCLMEMPTIDRIFRYARPAVLYVLGIDQDKNPADALACLKMKLKSK